MSMYRFPYLLVHINGAGWIDGVEGFYREAKDAKDAIGKSAKSGRFQIVDIREEDGCPQVESFTTPASSPV